MDIRFNFPYQVGKEIQYIKEALEMGRLAGGGPFSKRCSSLLESYLGVPKVLLTHSCTAALEMSAILMDIQPGDEVIMPSYTFVSTANAFTLRGGVPVFVDIRPDTLNLDESKIEAAITNKTKAICVVHYAGVGCEMDEIMSIANKHDLFVVEDAAQVLGSTYKGERLGSIGDFATFSFHETKNINSGEGGALVINNTDFTDRAEIVWEKGTNRLQFFRGEVDKYTWQDIGSSFLPSELVTAFLLAQLENIDPINAMRMKVWDSYRQRLSPLSQAGCLTIPDIPEHCTHNAHMFYILLNDKNEQAKLLNELKQNKIGAVFHYNPLHQTKAGTQYGRPSGELTVTENIYCRLVRLPLWPNLKEEQIDFVCEKIKCYFADGR